MDKLLTINRSKKSVLAAGILLFLFMLLLNCLTPYVADDYVYRESFVTKLPLKSLSDVMSSMYLHCFAMNGRIVSHFFDQLFMLWPKPVFNAVNALVYTVLMYLMYRVANFGRKGNLLLYLGICAAFWHFLPAFGQVALWQTGSVNYLWGLLAGLAFLCPFLYRFLYGREPLPRLWQKALFCVFALLFGMYTEVTSFIGLILAAALLVLAAIMKKGRLACWQWIPVAAAAAGFAIMLMMPAELGAKSDGLTLGALLINFRRSTVMLQTYCLTLLLVWAAAFILGLYARLEPEQLVLSLLLAAGGVAANYMLIVAQYYPERCMCTTIMLLVVSIAVLAAALCRTKFNAVCSCAGSALAVLFVFSLVLGAGDIAYSYSMFRQREAVIAEQTAAGETDLILDRVIPTTQYSAFWDLRDLATDTPDTWPNVSISRYYGVNSILGR